MLESLEKLRGDLIITFNPDEIASGVLRQIADKIQAEVDEKYIPRDEVDKFYLPRPLFEDGAPVQWGDRIAKGDFRMESPVDQITYYPDGTVEMHGNGIGIWLGPGERVSHQLDPDNQKKFDADYHDLKIELFHAASKGEINRDAMRWIIGEFDRMLARQQKLDGVE